MVAAKRAAAGIAASPPSSNAGLQSPVSADSASRTCSTQGRPATLHSASANVSTSIVQDCAATPRGERSHAVGAHVAEGHKPYLKFIWRDVIFQLCRRCPFGQPREAPSPASPALGRRADRHSSGRLLGSLIARNAPYPTA